MKHSVNWFPPYAIEKHPDSSTPQGSWRDRSWGGLALKKKKQWQQDFKWVVLDVCQIWRCTALSEFVHPRWSGFCRKNSHGYIQESLLGKKIMIEVMLVWHDVGVCNCNLLWNSWLNPKDGYFSALWRKWKERRWQGRLGSSEESWLLVCTLVKPQKSQVCPSVSWVW